MYASTSEVQVLMIQINIDYRKKSFPTLIVIKQYLKTVIIMSFRNKVGLTIFVFINMLVDFC